MRKLAARFNSYSMGILKTFAIAAGLFITTQVSAQQPTIAPGLLQNTWKAYWIAAAGTPAQGYGVYHFRKTIQLDRKPASYVVHVSADNRYKLFVNGTLASLGPARGDVMHWNFETVDLASFLQVGTNVLAAVVWNEGDSRPEAQISYRTGFVMQGNSDAEATVNTDTTWRAARDSSYSPLPPQLVYSYFVTGPGEVIDMRQSQRGWMQASFVDTTWRVAVQLRNAVPKGAFAFNEGAWMLVPRAIPQMELFNQRLQSVRKVEGITVSQQFPQQKTAVVIPAHTKATLLLDQGFLTNAYPALQFSGGRDAQLSLQYAEALYVIEPDNKDWRAQSQKGNRNEIDGKRFVGKEDRIISNGDAAQQFTPLWWRTFRYLQLKVETADAALTIDDLYSTFTGYPFQQRAQFDGGDTLFQKIMQVGWRTARLCAVETYMDCPYYEQLQYAGDTRIQALISLYNSGDDRLMRNAINLLDESRMAEGITLSRYPAFSAQQIPPFSLWWIGMLHDYWMYRPDAAFVKEKLPGLRQVLSFFARYQQQDGSLKNVPYWNFTDWCGTKGWQAGVAPVGKNGNSAALDLQLLWAYQISAQLEEALGMPAFAQQYKTAANKLQAAIRSKYWNATKNVFADTPEKDVYSQHVNALAILTGTVNGNNAASLAQKLLTDSTLTEATIYFKYYINQALIKAGLGNEYLNWLGIWKENLAQGMTTWAEMSDVNRSRSDCHAWGASPNIEFLRTVLGIDSDAPGFARVKIEPHLGTLKKASGSMPLPSGKIAASYIQTATGWKAVIALPARTAGYLLWNGKRYPLNAGQTTTLNL